MLRTAYARLTGSDGGIRRILLGAMATGFVMLIAIGVFAWSLLEQNRNYARWVNHTYDVEIAIGEFRVAMEQAETARRGYILTGSRGFSVTYDEAAGSIPGTLARIRELTDDNGAQAAILAAIRPDVAALTRMREETNRLVDIGDRQAALAVFQNDQSVPLMRRIRTAGAAMVANERGLLAERDALRDRTATTFVRVLAGAGLLILILAAASLATVMRYVRDLDTSAAALARLNDSLEDEVRERTADLTRANEEIQRFAYIVSHDLRSPLVNVMGFTAELDAATGEIAKLIDRAQAEAPQIVTREAELAAREDLPEAIGFIRTSTAKMDRLINAILKLSREGRRVLTPEPIDMVALVSGIRDSLVHRTDEEGTEITVAAPLPDIVSDRLAVEQILSNIVENATKYLEPGRPGRIVVSGQRQGPRVIYEVADNGRGIAPADHSRVFDLFRRAGRQDRPGEGIGLAHVRALAYRLGGTIDVRSALGEGSTFRLILPAKFDDRGETADDGK